MQTGERHEGDRRQGVSADRPVAQLLDEQELLHQKDGADRNDHAPAGLELRDERWGDLRRRSGDHDAIEGRLVRPAEVTIPLADLDGIETLLRQARRGLVRERRHDLDRVDLISER